MYWKLWTIFSQERKSEYHKPNRFNINYHSTIWKIFEFSLKMSFKLQTRQKKYCPKSVFRSFEMMSKRKMLWKNDFFKSLPHWSYHEIMTFVKWIHTLNKRCQFGFEKLFNFKSMRLKSRILNLKFNSKIGRKWLKSHSFHWCILYSIKTHFLNWCFEETVDIDSKK